MHSHSRVQSDRRTYVPEATSEPRQLPSRNEKYCRPFVDGRFFRATGAIPLAGYRTVLERFRCSSGAIPERVPQLELSFFSLSLDASEDLFSVNIYKIPCNSFGSYWIFQRNTTRCFKISPDILKIGERFLCVSADFRNSWRILSNFERFVWNPLIFLLLNFQWCIQWFSRIHSKCLRAIFAIESFHAKGRLHNLIPIAW